MPAAFLFFAVLVPGDSFITHSMPQPPQKPPQTIRVVETQIMEWPDLTTRPQPQPDVTLSYGPDPLQVIDIWQPAASGSSPAVIMIHGGCWQTEIAERDLMNWIADDLRRQGVGVWNIEYRGVDRNGGYPATFLDVGQAADLFREKAKQYNLRTDKVITIGHSAGGHLSLWLANRPNLPLSEPIRGKNPIKIDLAISQGGLPDLKAASQRIEHPCGTTAPLAMLGRDASITSPPEMNPGAARQVLFYNTLDKIAPPDYARAYMKTMAAKNISASLIETPAEGHVELIAPDSESWTRQRTLILKEFGLQ